MFEPTVGVGYGYSVKNLSDRPDSGTWWSQS